jgi:hypothetical protein
LLWSAATDQAKVDSIKAEIVEIYKEHGIAVGADTARRQNTHRSL